MNVIVQVRDSFGQLSSLRLVVVICNGKKKILSSQQKSAHQKREREKRTECVLQPSNSDEI